MRFGEPWVLYREASGAVRVLHDVCPHRGASLALGRIDGDHIACPFHGFQFDGNGHCRAIPAHAPDEPIPSVMRVRALPTKVEHELVWVWWGGGEPRGEPRFFEALSRMRFGELSRVWSTHYTRAIENQLDFLHLPFVHRTTIGRRIAPRMEIVTESDETFVRGRFADAEAGVRVELLTPNVWTLQVGRGITQFLAFMPVDDTHTEILCRAYHDRVRIPVVRELYELVLAWGNRVILGQDQAVVESQRPYETELGMSERLVPGDSPIAAYRRIRHRALKGALRVVSEDEPAAREADAE